MSAAMYATGSSAAFATAMNHTQWSGTCLGDAIMR